MRSTRLIECMYLALHVKLGPNRQVAVSLWCTLELAEGSITSRDILAGISRPGMGSENKVLEVERNGVNSGWCISPYIAR